MVYVAETPSVEETVLKVQTKVYKERIRLKEFFVDFDKLRSGYITQAQFKSGLSMANLQLTPNELQVLAESYANPDDPQLRVMHSLFCKHVDSVFGKTELEKVPREEVFSKPTGLVDPQRFAVLPGRDLGDEKEYKLALLCDKLQYAARTKRIQVKPFFDDFSKNQNSALKVNHVTAVQFWQVLKIHIAPDLLEEEVQLLLAKFAGDGMDADMVNYVAFARAVDPPTDVFDPYTLKAQ
jgi:hypothetical protein